MVGGPKTLLQLILDDWLAAGNKGQLTRQFIEEWHAANPSYGAGKWSLDTRFWSGSLVPVRGVSPLQRASAAWLSAGNPAFESPEFDRAAFDRYLDEHCDEYDPEFYEDRTPPPAPVPATKKATGGAKKGKR